MSATKDLSPVKLSVSVMTRLTPQQAKRLDKVKTAKPAVASRAAAVRRLIDLLTDADLEEVAVRATQEGVGAAPTDKELSVATRLLAAVEARTVAYNELAKQVRAVGVQNNQLVKLARHMTTFGREGHIPADQVMAFDLTIQTQVLPRMVELSRVDQMMTRNWKR